MNKKYFFFPASIFIIGVIALFFIIVSGNAAVPDCASTGTCSWIASDDYSRVNRGLLVNPYRAETGLTVFGPSSPTIPELIVTNGNVGIGTTTPAAKLDVAGSIRLGADSSDCAGNNEGVQRYNSLSKQMEFCDGSAWRPQGDSLSRVTCASGEYLKKTTTGWECVSGLWGPAGSLHYFVTSASYTGNMGGTVGMTNKCNSDTNRIAGRTYGAVTSSYWGIVGATYFGNSGNGINGVDSYTAASPYIWIAREYDCSSWTSSSGNLTLNGNGYDNLLHHNSLIGGVSTLDYRGLSCSALKSILCVEVAN